jgi:RNA ligase (TIGR02306 family)
MAQATLQRILNLQPIQEADKIEVATILGWKVVVQKGLYNVGDLVIFCEVDSFLPVRPEFEFLRKSSFKVMNNEEGFRIRTCKLKGQISQGLILPLNIIKPEAIYEGSNCISFTYDLMTYIIEEGTDVSNVLNIKHYEKPVPANMAGVIKGDFPSFLSKTDEVRIQSEPELLERLKGKPYYITVKCDGTSFTCYFKNGIFGVCSRNLELKEDENNAYWKVAKKYNIENILKELYEKIGLELCLQGELCGPGIMKNHLQLREIDLFIFNIYDISNGRYYSYEELVDFCIVNKLKTVLVIEKSEPPFKGFNYTQEQLLEKAKGKYEGTENNREGIVVRSLDKSISFKVLNNLYLLKDEE